MSEENMVMKASQFKELLTTIISESRKPVIDPMKVAQQERMKAHNKKMRKDAEAVLLQRFRGCNHMQLPGGAYTGCCCIAWATQSDGGYRGPCQHCGTVFAAKVEECVPAHPEVAEAYKYLIKLPTHPAGNVNYTFQHA